MSISCIYGGECNGCLECKETGLDICSWCQEELCDHYYEINDERICAGCIEGCIVYKTYGAA